MKCTIRSTAREDVLRQYSYYLTEENAEAAAERFLLAVQVAVEEICRHPHVGVRKVLDNQTLQGLRSWRVKGFPSMRIYYLSTPKHVDVLRVLHSKRDVQSVLADDDNPRQDL